MVQTLVDVAIDVRTGGAEAVWTYSSETSLPIGTAVLVQLGPRTAIGFVIACYQADPTERGLTERQLKVAQPVRGLSLPVPLLETVQEVAAEYLCPISVALSPTTPPGVTELICTRWEAIEGATIETETLSTVQAEVLAGLNQQPLAETKKSKLPTQIRKALDLLVVKGYVRRIAAIESQETKSQTSLLRLSASAEKIEKFLQKEGRKKPAQALTLIRLQTVGSIALEAGEIKALSGVTDQTLKALVNAGFLEPIQEIARVRGTPPTPNPEQREAIDRISVFIGSQEFKPFLLFGVTGSGKTEVFLQAAANALTLGRQVLYLVPEIALAAQAISQLRDRFGDRVAIIHSELSVRERLATWIRIQRGEIAIVLGARSALFAPLNNIGLIIIDEEHETSYKQESSPRYHAKRIALSLGKRHNAPVVLGSATPSIESYYEAQSGEIELLTLTKRAAAANMPTVFIDDLSEGYRKGHPVILANELRTRLETILLRKEQAILFLNRRAYAPFLMCRDCGKQFMCPRCSVSLSFSRKEGKLRCHHCDFRQDPPDVCPDCCGTRLNPLGIGTEKVEEAVKQEFPDAKVARLDRDIAKRKGALEQILAEFRSGQIEVLVGTQMVAKGLDFPRVTLVGVIAADMSLNMPDFRASERTYQLLSQVAGRAGRSVNPGEVVIQTFNPDHVTMQCAKDHDYPRLAESITSERELVGYPPFKRLVNIMISSESRALAIETSYSVAVALEGVPDWEVLGPTDAVLEKLQNRWRRHLLIKMPRDAKAAEIGARVQGLSDKHVSVVIDVDPYSMV